MSAHLIGRLSLEMSPIGFQNLVSGSEGSSSANGQENRGWTVWAGRWPGPRLGEGRKMTSSPGTNSATAKFPPALRK